MKHSSVPGVLFACALIAVAGVARGAVAIDDAAAKALLKKSDCTKCHAIDKDKKGPSYQKIAAELKGKADAEAKVVKSITLGQKVKLGDGSEEEHKRVATSDEAQIKGLAAWILAR